MSNSNTWLNGSEQPERAKEIVEFLEQRARYPDQIKINNDLINVLNPQNGETFFEAGSGSGIICRLIAHHLSPEGHITGIDISPEIVKLSKLYAQKEDLSNLITFQVGDASKLIYPNETFDAAFAARLLLYMVDPLKVVNELIRVVKPGGRVVLMDWDFETLAVNHSDRELTRRIFHWRNDNKDGNNWSGRQLYSLLKDGGLNDITVYPIITFAFDETSSLTHSLWHAASSALEEGIITIAEHDSWISELKVKIKNQQFFASINYYIVHSLVT